MSYFVLRYLFNGFLYLLDVLNIIFFDMIIKVRIELGYIKHMDTTYNN